MSYVAERVLERTPFGDRVYSFIEPFLTKLESITGRGGTMGNSMP